MLHENIGAVHLDAGQLAAARDEFARAIRANPASAQGHAGLATVAFKSGDRDTAVGELEARREYLDPTNWDALYNLGVQLMRVGRMTEARPYLERFVRTAPASQYAKDIKAISAELAIPLDSSIRCHPCRWRATPGRLRSRLGVRPVSDPSLALL